MRRPAATTRSPARPALHSGAGNSILLHFRIPRPLFEGWGGGGATLSQSPRPAVPVRVRATTDVCTLQRTPQVATRGFINCMTSSWRTTLPAAAAAAGARRVHTGIPGQRGADGNAPCRQSYPSYPPAGPTATLQAQRAATQLPLLPPSPCRLAVLRRTAPSPHTAGQRTGVGWNSEHVFTTCRVVNKCSNQTHCVLASRAINELGSCVPFEHFPATLAMGTRRRALAAWPTVPRDRFLSRAALHTIRRIAAYRDGWHPGQGAAPASVSLALGPWRGEAWRGVPARACERDGRLA